MRLGLDIAPGALVYVLPCIAGHVGADTAGVVLSEGPYLSEEIRLLVDVGTNAEIVLGNKDRLLAASSPTGPAFEGAQISCGQRAAPGAIERVRIDRETLEPRYKVIGCDLWSDEPGFAEATEQTGVTGICGSGIIEVIAEMFLAGIISEDGVIDGALAERTPRVEAVGRTFAYVLREGEPRLVLYQTDVRAIQLAKSALYAGAKLLMDRYGIQNVDRVTLAGAFGSHIDPLYAMVLGLIPDCDLDKVGSAGNAAGTGARIALVNAGMRAEIERVVLGHREDRDRDRAELSGTLRRSHGAAQQGRPLSQAARSRPFSGARRHLRRGPGGSAPPPPAVEASPAADCGSPAHRLQGSGSPEGLRCSASCATIDVASPALCSMVSAVVQVEEGLVARP